MSSIVLYVAVVVGSLILGNLARVRMGKPSLFEGLVDLFERPVQAYEPVEESYTKKDLNRSYDAGFADAVEYMLRSKGTDYERKKDTIRIFEGRALLATVSRGKFHYMRPESAVKSHQYAPVLTDEEWDYRG